jgi:hypothetical protein
MCTVIVHTYGCGHEVRDEAPCAQRRAGKACKGVSERKIPHTEKCEKICGGW